MDEWINSYEPEPGVPIIIDEVPYYVNWDKFNIGYSIFIPGINTQEILRKFKKEAQLRDMEVRSAARVEGARWGIRFWRIA